MWQTLANTTNNVGQNALNILTALGEKLGIVALHLYQVLVKQQVILGFQLLVQSISMLILLTALIGTGLYVNKKTNWDKLDKQVVTLVLITLIYCSFTTAISYVVKALPLVLNPEYYAIQDAARMLKEVRR